MAQIKQNGQMFSRTNRNAGSQIAEELRFPKLRVGRSSRPRGSIYNLAEDHVVLHKKISTGFLCQYCQIHLSMALSFSHPPLKFYWNAIAQNG